MNQPDAVETVEKFEQTLKRAQDLLAAADEGRAQAGFASRHEAQEFLETQLSKQEIADVDDEVAQEIGRIHDEIAANQLHDSGSRGIPTVKRHTRQII